MDSANATNQASPQPGVNYLTTGTATPVGEADHQRGGEQPGISEEEESSAEVHSCHEKQGGEGSRTFGPTPSSFREAEKRSLCSVQGLTSSGESIPDLPTPKQCSFH